MKDESDMISQSNRVLADIIVSAIVEDIKAIVNAAIDSYEAEELQTILSAIDEAKTKLNLSFVRELPF